MRGDCDAMSRNKWKINMWGGIIGDTVLLYELPETMNSAQYLLFLGGNLPQLLAGVNPQPTWFQQDGAPCHSSGDITNFLNAQYGQQWLGRYGPVRWPPRSPDLTPLDYYL
ncbi:uncharacterized protein LOC141526786 isoform X1 [Cotesia typhae]|uniref:uncharacterized protein LOC141526786 isoform X1 n=2 Tax=Cotesia typhae TaxID=2053667 RepID=UPI003D69FA2A